MTSWPLSVWSSIFRPLGWRLSDTNGAPWYCMGKDNSVVKTMLQYSHSLCLWFSSSATPLASLATPPTALCCPQNRESSYRSMLSSSPAQCGHEAHTSTITTNSITTLIMVNDGSSRAIYLVWVTGNAPHTDNTVISSSEHKLLCTSIRIGEADCVHITRVR